ELAVELCDYRPPHLVGLSSANFGVHQPIEDVLVEGGCPRFKFGLNMLVHEPIGQISHRWCSTFGGPLACRILTIGHSPTDGLGAPAGDFWGNFAHRGDGVAPKRGTAS